MTRTSVATAPWRRHGVAVMAAGAVIAAATNFMAPAAQADATSSDPVTPSGVASEATSPGVLDTLAASGTIAASDDVRVSTDGDSALTSTVKGVSIDVPRDADDPVTVVGSFTAAGGVPVETPAISVKAPAAPPAATDAVVPVSNGVVATAGPRGALNVVQPTESGALAMSIVVLDSAATEDYVYDVAPPAGGRIELADDGGAVVLDAAGSPVGHVQAPWAKTSAEDGLKPVPTTFRIEGGQLVQHIDHQGLPASAYPIHADPVLAVVAAAAAWAAIGCGTQVVQRLLWTAGKAALRAGRYDYRVREAADDCLQGAVFGAAGRVIPGFIKQAVLNSVRPLVVTTLLQITRRV